MSEPIVFISTHKIKPGMLDAFRQHSAEASKRLEATKPGTVAFLAYLNEAGTEVNIVHVFPDAEAMDRHMQGVGERAQAALEFLEPVSYEIYGQPSDPVSERMRQFVATGAALRVKPQYFGGYLRLKSG